MYVYIKMLHWNKLYACAVHMILRKAIPDAVVHFLALLNNKINVHMANPSH